MNSLTIPRLYSGGIITNYSCNSKCGHCLYNCGPFRENDYLSPETAKDLALRIFSLGCSSVHIGGGEPFLKPTALIEVVKAILSAGVSIDYIETNAFWSKDSNKAEAIVKELLAEGVTTLLVSISPFHNETIPFSRVQNLFEICFKSGMAVFPWKEFFIPEINQLDSNSTHSLTEYETLFGSDYLPRIPERYWVRFGGRAIETYRAISPTYSVEQVLNHNLSDCYAELTNTSHFHIDLYGNYVPGLCIGLAIIAEDLKAALSAEDYPVLTTLSSEGITGLYDLATKETGFTPNQKSFLNKCDLCIELRTHLQTRGFSVKELQPLGFYSVYTGQ